MTVKEKIAEKRKKLAERKAEQKAASPAIKTFNVKCVKCQTPFVSTSELDLDGQGRCPLCQAIRDAEIAEIIKKYPTSPHEYAPPSYFETPGIEYKGIKFVPLH